MGNSPESIHFETWAWSSPEKLSEHGAGCFYTTFDLSSFCSSCTVKYTRFHCV